MIATRCSVVAVVMAIMLCTFHRSYAADMVIVSESRFTLGATVVLPTCNVVVQTESGNGKILDFGVHDKSLSRSPTVINFSLVAFEHGASEPGCSSFLAAPVTTISFGNPGQLDEQGVITNGAGDVVRIVVRAKNKEASYKQNISIYENRVQYPSSFSSKGTFIFEAQAVNLEHALAGEYRGSLSFVVSYQ